MTSPKKKGVKTFSVKIYDVENEKILWNNRVQNPELIGRLKTGLFLLTDGHLYYNNKVIKIRYDLINKKNAKELAEHEAFDYFENILELD